MKNKKNIDRLTDSVYVSIFDSNLTFLFAKNSHFLIFQNHGFDRFFNGKIGITGRIWGVEVVTLSLNISFIRLR